MLNLQRLAFLNMGNTHAGLIHDMDASIASARVRHGISAIRLINKDSCKSRALIVESIVSHAGDASGKSSVSQVSRLWKQNAE